MGIHVRQGWRPALVAGFIVMALLGLQLFLGQVPARAQDGDIFAPVKSGNLAAVKSILDAKPDAAKARDRNQYTPLIWAARNGHLAVLKLLLDRGADVNAVNKWNNTALHWAAYKGHVPVVEFLCRKGAKMDIRESDKGHTPLHDAAWRGHLGVVQAMLKHGAPVGVRNNRGERPLDVALRYRQMEVAKLIQKHAQAGGGAGGGPSGGPSGGGGGPSGGGDALTPDQARIRLFGAVKSGDAAMVRKILGQFPQLVKARGKNRYTPLIWAARQGHMPIVDFLINKGADINAVNKWNNTALHWAAYNGRTAVIILLAKKGARLDIAENEKGHMPLHDAAWRCRLGAVAALLKAGAPAAALNKLGQTPAQVALKFRCPAAAELIQRHIKAGAGGGETPPKGPGPGPVTPPKKVPPPAQTDADQAALFTAVKGGDLKQVAMILGKKPKLAGARDEKGYTPLIWAARKGNVAMCALLMLKGADVNAVNKWNNTALHWAAYGGHASVVAYLLRKGAKTNIQENQKGNMPLHDAAAKGHSAVILLLIKGGAPINAKNKFGLTPLAVALKAKQMVAAKVLREKGATQ
jgi:ankyrin repeat protein